AAGLRDDGVIARPAAAADRTAAAMEQSQPHAMALEYFDEADLGLVELPARGDETAVLVAVGVAEHHFLHRAAAVHQFAIIVQRQHPVHYGAGSLQILDGFEQRHDIDRAAAGGIDEAGFLQEQRNLEHVGHPLAHGDDALGNRVRAELGVRFGGRVEDRELAQCLLAVFDEGRSEEHTSELQSLAYLVCRLLLEKKKQDERPYIV